jgi:2-amino-4-hydroxy-6-hydroxymethyldihydropteridine diphosphokinase
MTEAQERLLEPAASVYIGLGANLDDPVQQVERALSELDALDETRLVTVSPRYRTAPVGPADQPDFVNAVAQLKTRLAPLALLGVLQDIERRHGRMRNARRWGPRPLDLDILLFGAQVLDLPELRVPHPRMIERAFVLVPLADIAPADLMIPGRGPLRLLLERLEMAAGSIEPLDMPRGVPADRPLGKPAAR